MNNYYKTTILITNSAITLVALLVFLKNYNENSWKYYFSLIGFLIFFIFFIISIAFFLIKKK